MIVTMNSKEVLKRRADARFRQEARALDGRKAMTEYEAQVLAIRENTARLRALRLAKEAQVQSDEPAPKQKFGRSRTAANNRSLNFQAQLMPTPATQPRHVLCAGLSLSPPKKRLEQF